MTIEAYRCNVAADCVVELAAAKYQEDRDADTRRRDGWQWTETYTTALRIACIEAHCWEHFDSKADRRPPLINTDKAAEQVTQQIPT